VDWRFEKERRILGVWKILDTTHKERIRHMEQLTDAQQALQLQPQDVLNEILRQGARTMLAAAVENEVGEYVAAHRDQRDDQGQRLVVRNGHLPQRSIQTGLGPIEVRQARVNDRRSDGEGNRIRFTSKILPPYLRRTKAIEELIPWLYLRGISTGDFPQALEALLGPHAKGLSATNVVRLKTAWEAKWKSWSQRSLAGKQYVYVWADGMHFNIRLVDEGNRRQCILVLMGATPDGTKELIAIGEGYREPRAAAAARRA
jgi:putative transposase